MASEVAVAKWWGLRWSFVGPRALQTKAPDARWQSAGVPQNVPSELPKVVARLAVLVEGGRTRRPPYSEVAGDASN